MMKLTNEDKARLATELCGGREGYFFNDWWLFERGPRIHKGKFDPLHNGVHTLLVLERLVKRHPGRAKELFEDLAGNILLICQNPETLVFDFPSAVCTAGLEVLGKDGGK